MITIITPTYNRAYILAKLYRSLCEQTDHQFEWIVIDDGSKDTTEEIVKKWIEDTTLFSIQYLKQPNGGKHRAVNRAVKYAAYPWCFIVDSDDFLTSNAVALVHLWIREVQDDRGFAGVSGLKRFISSNTVIGGYPAEVQYKDYIDATNLERHQYGLSGDKAEVYRTEILKKYPFPEFKNEKFLSEEVVWNAAAADGYRIRWYPVVIYLCEYIGDGLTKSGDKKLVDNFKGFTYHTKQSIQLFRWKEKQVSLLHYMRIAKLKGRTFHSAMKNLGISFPYLCVIWISGKMKNAFVILHRKRLRGIYEKLKNKQ